MNFFMNEIIKICQPTEKKLVLGYDFNQNMLIHTNLLLVCNQDMTSMSVVNTLEIILKNLHENGV